MLATRHIWMARPGYQRTSRHVRKIPIGVDRAARIDPMEALRHE